MYQQQQQLKMSAIVAPIFKLCAWCIFNITRCINSTLSIDDIPVWCSLHATSGYQFRFIYISCIIFVFCIFASAWTWGMQCNAVAEHGIKVKAKKKEISCFGAHLRATCSIDWQTKKLSDVKHSWCSINLCIDS